MAIRAAPADELLRGPVGRYARAGIEGSRVIGLAVALLAEEGHTDLQHARLIGAVGVMTVRAVFTHGLVLPQERAAFFRVALVADLVDRVLGQLMRAGRAVRVVAIGTDDLAVPDRVVRALVDSSPLVLVTGETDLGLGHSVAYRVIHGHDVVAVDAGITGPGMDAGAPVQLQSVLVALLANGCLLFTGQFAHLERDNQRRFAPRRLQMFAHGSMAGFAAVRRQLPAHAAHGKFFHVFLVAFDTLRTAFDECRALQFGIEGDPVFHGHITVELCCCAYTHMEQQT